MDPPEELRILHQPTRLAIMAVVCRFRDVGFADLRDHLGLTDGNLGSHAARLETAGLIESRRALGRTGVVVRYRPTPKADRCMDLYRAWLASMEPPLDAGPDLTWASSIRCPSGSRSHAEATPGEAVALR